MNNYKIKKINTDIPKVNILMVFDSIFLNMVEL